jgi:broad specificity phosphatase PhoE
MRHVKRVVAAWSATTMIMVLAAASLAAQSTTVILVRHAEKAATPADDPPLTAAGEARSKALWDVVKDAGVDAIITTQFIRTKATAEPTAAMLKITPEVINASAANHPRDVAAAIRKHAGHTVLVVGHSNTVPSIIEALGAVKPPPICDLEYDNLYIVTLGPSGKPGLVRSRFGERATDTSCVK